MPIYEYQCAGCGHIEEVLQSFSDKPLSTCDKCSGKLHKLISQSAFHLKGSGWYVTDYANKSSAGNKSKTKSDTDTPSASDNSKSSSSSDKSKSSKESSSG